MVSCAQEPGNLTNLVVGVEILQDLKANPLAGRPCSNAVYTGFHATCTLHEMRSHTAGCHVQTYQGAKDTVRQGLVCTVSAQ